MADKTDEKSARENRQRLFREEGARAMEDVANDAIAVRKNMARLRALRIAKEAEAAPMDGIASKAKPVKPAKKKRIIPK